MIFKHNSNFDVKLTSNIEPSKKGADKFYSDIGFIGKLIAWAFFIYIMTILYSTLQIKGFC